MSTMQVKLSTEQAAATGAQMRFFLLMVRAQPFISVKATIKAQFKKPGAS